MKTLIKAFWRALIRACVELIESESGEFMTTREKSHLLHAMMQENMALAGETPSRQRRVSHLTIEHSPT